MRAIRFRQTERPSEEYIRSVSKDWDIALAQVPDSQLIPMFELMLSRRTSNFQILPSEILETWLRENERNKAARVEAEQKAYNSATTKCPVCLDTGWERVYKHDSTFDIEVSGVVRCLCNAERVSNNSQIDQAVKTQLEQLKKKTGVIARKYSMNGEN